jgi:hypothetical protein
VARPVLHVGDETVVIAARILLAEDCADRLHDVDVAHLRVAADVVRLAGPAARKHGADRRAMVADVEPVAHVHAVAIPPGSGLARDRVDDHERDELLRKLPRTVVVRAGWS